MDTSEPKVWKHLEPRPCSNYRQLFLKGRRIRASVIHLLVTSADMQTPEEVAAAFDLPLEAVHEAIAYCESNPPEVERDFRIEEALVEASGMNDPDYKYNPGSRKLLTPQEKARIMDMP